MLFVINGIWVYKPSGDKLDNELQRRFVILGLRLSEPNIYLSLCENGVLDVAKLNATSLTPLQKVQNSPVPCGVSQEQLFLNST